MPKPAQLTAIALRVADEAYARSRRVPGERTAGLRLALAWLVHAGVAKDWQAMRFWRDLAQHDPEEVSGSIGYCRQTLLNGLLTNWYYAAGIPHEEVLKRSSAVLYDPVEQQIDLEALADQIWRMCNRGQPGEKDTIRKAFKARQLFDFNVGPSIVHPREPGMVVRLHEGERVLEQMTWGFPVVLRGKNGQPLKPKPVNNARFDKLGGYWRRWAQAPDSRCLIPVERFAEAEGDYGSMTTTWLSLKDDPMFAWAGLWTKDIGWGQCYTGVMTAGALDVHDRCPVILPPDDWDTWLTAPLAELKRFDRPPAAERFIVDRTNVPWSRGGQMRLDLR